MPPGVIIPSNVTLFPPEPAIAADREKLDNLGGQISAIAQSFNELKQELVADSNLERKAKFVALLDQRREAIEAAMDAWKAHSARVGIVKQPPALQGLGQVDLTSLQTQIAGEQEKLAALQSYYTAYKTAVETGQTPPAVPAELASGGFLGISTGTIIAGIALLAAGWYFFTRK
jgi:hypothetical protein